MASRIWEPLEQSAKELRFGILQVEVLVQHGRVYRIREQSRTRSWTEQDLEQEPLVD